MTPLSPAQDRFARSAVRKKRLFGALSAIGVLVALGLALATAVRRWQDPGFQVGGRVVIVVLILLNARQNLRQLRYASVLERLLPPRGC